MRTHVPPHPRLPPPPPPTPHILLHYTLKNFGGSYSSQLNKKEKARLRRQKYVWFVSSTVRYRMSAHYHSHPNDTVCLLVGHKLTFQQHASAVSLRRICSHNFTCSQTEIEVADRFFFFYLTQSQYTLRPTSPSADPITPGA